MLPTARTTGRIVGSRPPDHDALVRKGIMRSDRQRGSLYRPRGRQGTSPNNLLLANSYRYLRQLCSSRKPSTSRVLRLESGASNSPSSRVDRHAGAIALEELPRRHVRRDGVVDGVEDLEAEAVLLEAEMRRSGRGRGRRCSSRRCACATADRREAGETVILVRLDDVADAQRVDVGAGSAWRRRARSSRSRTLDRP